MKKEYQDYGEYLEDAYEEQSERYGTASNHVEITQKNGILKAIWRKIWKRL